MARRKKPAGAAETGDAWLDSDPVEIPRPGAPATEQTARRARTLRGYVWAAIWAVPVLLLLNLVTLAQTFGPRPAAETNVTMTSPPSKAVALQAVTTWLEQPDSPLPGGRIVDWESVRTVPNPELDDPEDNAAQPTIEVHTVRLASTGGQLWSAQVSTATTPAGSVPIGQPALAMTAPAGTSAATIDRWPRHDPTSPSEAVHTAVNSWARAYFGTDPQLLRQTVGDTRADVSYVPLAGADAAEVSVGDAAGIWDGTGRANTNQAPEAMIVAVEVATTWGGATTTPATPAAGSVRTEDLPTIAFDVLVTGTDTAAPRVVAWGAPGSGELLTPWSNAIPGATLAAQPSWAPPTPTATPTPEPSR